jgi:predicted ribosome quality control (RQC) complex YloA/Tae2 family protein
MKIIEDIYVLGENAQDNWKILSESSPNDYFFHLSSFPSCYVILKCEDIPTLEHLTRASEICKSATKYRNLRNIKVDYCMCSNVKKGSVVGEAVFVSNRKVKQIKI